MVRVEGGAWEKVHTIEKRSLWHSANSCAYEGLSLVSGKVDIH